MDEIETGGLLGGRIAYRQFKSGHRTGFEPVLLAANVAAAAGELVLEAGTGAGAGLLCLAMRVPGVLGVGVERDSGLARLAQKNFNSNNFSGIFAIQGDAVTLPFGSQKFHHIFANPPWFSCQSTASPDALRALAHLANPELLPAWIASLTRVLRPKGTLTLILPAASHAAATAALREHYGCITLFPLWPRFGEPSKMVIVSARKGSKSPDRILPGMVLHDADGITREAQAVLRDGASLKLG